MNPKFVVYTLVALLTGSTLPAVAIGDRAVAHETQSVADRPTTSAPTTRSTSMSMEVDKAFIEMMIPHHQSANDMAKMALSKAKSPEVKRLAQKIIDEQTREIQQMRSYYRQWYGSDVPMQGMEMSRRMGQPMQMTMQQMEVMNRGMMQALQSAPDFDREFLSQMTQHHQMATMMAGMVVDTAKHPEIRRLADSIIRSQTDEIAQMQQLLMQARRQ